MDFTSIGLNSSNCVSIRVIDNKSLRLITDASVSSPVSRERSGTLDPTVRGIVCFDSLWIVVIHLVCCVLLYWFFMLKLLFIQVLVCSCVFKF